MGASFISNLLSRIHYFSHFSSSFTFPVILLQTFRKPCRNISIINRKNGENNGDVRGAGNINVETLQHVNFFFLTF